MTDCAEIPWGLARMEPFPAGPRVPRASIVLDHETQVGRRLDQDGIAVPMLDKHRKTNTAVETTTTTGDRQDADQGHDQSSDSD